MEITGQVGKWVFSVLMIFTLCILWSDSHPILRKQCKSKRKTAQYHPSFPPSCQPSSTRNLSCIPKVKIHTTLTGEESN